jgi:hypothetical protein
MTLQEDMPQWRFILSHEWDNATQERREEICDFLNLSPQTIRRWNRGEGKPKSRQTLVKLEELIPEISPALRQEFASFFIDSHDTLIRSMSPVFDRVIQAYNDTDQTRIFITITEIVLDALVRVIDIEGVGVVAILGQLLSSAGTEDVDHLLFYSGSCHGTGEWFENQAHTDYRVDARSLSGRAVIQGFPVYSRNRDDLGQGALLCAPQIESAAAIPVRRYGGGVAGVVFVASAVPDFFTRLKRDTIGQYTQLMSLAFKDADFITKGHIRLAHSNQESIRMTTRHLLDLLRREHPDMSREQLQQLAREYEV